MASIGLLGGTFDPFHNGHLQLGEAAMRNFGLDKILFIPAAHPPHKNEKIVCEISHRLQMLQLGVAGNDFFEISEIEISRSAPSYTIETIHGLQQQAEAGTSFYFIIGYDAILEIETWYCWQELLISTNFIVAIRPGFSLEKVESLLGRNGFSLQAQTQNKWVHRLHDNEIWFLTDHIVDISSTDIRKRIEENRDWRHMVPAAVSSYIVEKTLYVN